MKKPKYEIGQKVWLLEGKKAKRKMIKGCVMGWNEYCYTFLDLRDALREEEKAVTDCKESELFPTKEELIASL